MRSWTDLGRQCSGGGSSKLGVENRGHDLDLEGRGYEPGSWSMVIDLSQHLSAIMSSSQQ